MKLRLFFIFVVLVALSCMSACRGQKRAVQDAATPEEYAVYNAYLQSLKFKPEQKMLVIADVTGRDDLHPETEGTISPYARQKLPEADDALITAFVETNKTPAQLAEHFDLPVKVVLVSPDRVSEVFKKSGGRGWEAFYQEYPGSQGFGKLSRVGFSTDGTKALLEVNNRCGVLCGGGTMILLVKKDGAWTVRGTAEFWVS